MFVKFKEWLRLESVVGTAVLNGGIGEAPNQNLNVNMPVRSKISTNDGTSPQGNKEELEKSPEEIFGFKYSKDRKQSKERKSMTQDIGKRFPLDVRKPSSYGFSQ